MGKKNIFAVVLMMAIASLFLMGSTAFGIRAPAKSGEAIFSPGNWREFDLQKALLSSQIRVDDEDDDSDSDDDDDEDGKDYEGVVISIGNGRLVLDNGTTFVFDDDTEIDAGIEIGDRVEVEAVLLAVEIEAYDEDEDDAVEAHDDANADGVDDDKVDDDGADVEVAGPTFSGSVAAISATNIRLSNGFGFNIGDDTIIVGDPQVGDSAQITFQISQGRFLAKKIVVGASSGKSQGTAKAEDEEDDLEELGGIVLDELDANVDNSFFPLVPFTLSVQEGEEEDEGEILEIRVETRVLGQTMEVADVDVRVALVEEYEDGELVERTLDFYAQDEDGVVYYMGELVDNFDEGVMTDHGGQWLAGDGDNLPGVFMPANPQIGDQFEQERAPGIAEDRSSIVAAGLSVITEAGSWSGCIKTEDSDPIGGSVENKYYCPNVGMVREEPAEGLVDLISIGTFSPDDIDQDVIDAIGGGLPEDDEKEDDDGEDDD